MSHLTRENNMLLSDQLKREDKNGKFIELYDSYLKQPVIFREEHWFKKIDKINKKSTKELIWYRDNTFPSNNEKIFIEKILTIREA
tara:strand:+ start:282 stop:539 length:258 start_codon:yes stop_codon:yes gene_type:complete